MSQDSKSSVTWANTYSSYRYHYLKARRAPATDASQKSYTKPASSSSKPHKEWVILCDTSSRILAGNHCFLHKLWYVFAHANELFPVLKNTSLSPFPLAKPASNRD